MRLQRRHLAPTLAALLTLVQQAARAAGTIVAARVWPAPEYTRITLESDTPLHYSQQLLSAPERLVVDVTDTPITPALRELAAKVQASDPNVGRIRIGQYSANVVRIVVDLKHPIDAQVFSLPPVAAYRNRLVFDLYPTQAQDPLEQFLAQNNAPDGSLTTIPELRAVENGRDEHGLADLIARHSTAAIPPDTTGHTATTAAPPPLPAAAPARPLPPATGRKSTRPIIVAIDPGHGGEDPGAIGPTGTREKDIVLRIAHLLRERIDRSTATGRPMRAYMTRDADYFVPLNVRVQKARRVQADLFISIHANAFITPQANGSSVFALSQRGASSSTARWLASKENEADLVGGLNVRSRDAHIQQALLDMSTTAQIRDSLLLGSILLGEIGRINRLHNNKVEQAGFAVLKAPDIPSVLVETAFVSNPQEERRLRDSAFQTRMADTLLRAIQTYFQRNPPMQRSRQG